MEIEPSGAEKAPVLPPNPIPEISESNGVDVVGSSDPIIVSEPHEPLLPFEPQQAAMVKEDPPSGASGSEAPMEVESSAAVSSEPVIPGTTTVKQEVTNIESELAQAPATTSPESAQQTQPSTDSGSNPQTKPKSADAPRVSKQAKLDFSRGAISLSIGPTTSENGISASVKEEPAVNEPGTKKSNGSKKTLLVKLPLQKDFLEKIEHTLKTVPPKRKPAKRKPVLVFNKDVSRTTIITDKSRISRNYPGPLLPLTYDLYDGNLMNAPANASVAAEKLALGFPVTHESSSFDIAYIIAYLLKFESVLQLGPLGPEDFEDGLRLTANPDEAAVEVSPAMNQVFLRLLALVLNRKKPITRDGQRPAIQELKTKYIGFGLPSEWRDDSNIHNVRGLPCNPAEDRVDMSVPEISRDDFVEYEGPAELMNPFHEEDFENYGLSGISNARDRCILLRTMAMWSLCFSTAIKKYLVDVVNNQEVPGERDIYYGSRAILKSFVRTKDLKRELDLKRKKSKSKAANGLADPVVDPTSDPLQHPMALRLNEFVVGDCGFDIGRFYLVRMADQSSGRVASVDQMRTLSKDFGAVRSSIPSGFRLYVEDVRAGLAEALEEFGVEFDSRGKEVKSKRKFEPADHWFTVASNAAELEDFLEHLSLKLGLRAENSDSISKNSVAYKPILHMYQYLSLMAPMLSEYEKLNVIGSSEVRTSRRKKVDYTAQPAWDDDYQEEPKDRAADDDYSDEEMEEEPEEEDFLE